MRFTHTLSGGIPDPHISVHFYASPTEIAHGVGVDDVRAATGAEFTVAPDLKEIQYAK